MRISRNLFSAVADSVSRDGKTNTAYAAGIVILLIAAEAGFYIWRDNNKYKKAIDLADAKSKNTINQNNAKCDNAIKQTEAKTESAIKLDDRKTANKERILRIKAELAANKVSQNKTFETNIEVSPMKSFDDILAMEDAKLEDRILLYTFLQKGGSLGICGPTNIGKTTFVFQLLLNLATGKCEYPIAANHYPTQPQKVLLFSTEQNLEEIKFEYKAVTDWLPHFTIETEETSPEEILAKVNMELERADSKGLIIAIDNYTWLKNAYDTKQLKLLDRELNHLQRTNQKNKPITIIKVFHTNDKYRIYRPVEIHHVQGGQNIANLTKNFIFITPCGKGHDTRILKVAKDKVGGTKDTVSVLKYAGTDPHQFVYDGEAAEADVLPLRRSSSNQDATIATPSKRGPKEKYSEPELMEMQQEFEIGFSWREVLEGHGIKYSKNKLRGIKAAMERHGIRVV